MEIKRDDLSGPETRMKKLATPRNFCILAGVLLIAYALFGYFNDKILIFSGRSGTGPQYAHGEQAILTALGYVSFAVAAFILAGTRLVRSSERPAPQISSHAVMGIVFILIGIVLVGFRTPN